jgi:glutathione synthase/RimK-type ligase-like ATP-grasp enzyme
MQKRTHPRILLATIPGDLHAFTIAEILQLKGGEPVLWFTSDYPTKAVESVQADEAHIDAHIPEVGGWSFHSIWTRRVHHEMPQGLLARSDYTFADLQCRRFRQALLAEFLAPGKAETGLCVNPYSAAIGAENKLTQYFAAQRVGLDMPRSLFSNDPARIRAFIEDQGGRAAFKPLRSILWVEGERELLNLTTVITAADLVEDQLLQLSPCIYQEVVPKSYELRVTMMGQRAFAAKVNSQETGRGRVDWRRAYDELTMERARLPRGLETSCWKLLRELDLFYGCFDFIVTPDNRYVFLEVNQGGQFLFVEEYTGWPLADAFAEFLLQGRSDFMWEESASNVTFKSVLEAATKKAAASFDEHVASEPPKIVEGSDLRPSERRRAFL